LFCGEETKVFHLKFAFQAALTCSTTEYVEDHGQQPTGSKPGSINSKYRTFCNILLDLEDRKTSIRKKIKIETLHVRFDARAAVATTPLDNVYETSK